MVTNVQKEIDKHGISLPQDTIDVLSYDKAVNRKDDLIRNGYGLVVADEAHKLRNPSTKRYQALNEIITNADKRMLLTGTLDYNRLSDISPVINMAANDPELLPKGKEFDKKFLGERAIKQGFWDKIRKKPVLMEDYIKDEDALRKVLRKYVDVHNISQRSEDYPDRIERVIQVPMDQKQLDIYRYLEGSIPENIKKKIHEGLPLSKKESKDLNSYLAGVRQASDSIATYEAEPSGHVAPKISRAANSMIRDARNPGFKGVVYSNYIGAGLDPYSKILQDRNIEFSKFTGGMSAREKKAIVDAFNQDSDKGKVLLLSSSGGEGLDLKGVRKVQVLEPHFNRSKIDQVVSRAVRYKSHEHLPEDQRNVNIEYYQAVRPRPDGFIDRLRGKKPEGSIDTYLHDLSNDKYALGAKLFGGQQR